MRRHGGKKADRGWLQAHNFGDEPICYEDAHDPSDVLYSGSDDEAYESATAREARCEAQAQRFLQGRPMFLLSATLQGPFTKESGWENPWRSSSSKVSKSKTKTVRGGQRMAPQAGKIIDDTFEDGDGLVENGRQSNGVKSKTRSARTSLYPLPSPESADAQSSYDYNEHMDLDAYVRVTEWVDGVTAKEVSRDSFWVPDRGQVTEELSTKRKRAEGSSWLRRRDSKRACSGMLQRPHESIDLSGESQSTDESKEEMTSSSSSSMASTNRGPLENDNVSTTAKRQPMTLLVSSRNDTQEELPATNRRRPDAARSLEDPPSLPETTSSSRQDASADSEIENGISERQEAGSHCERSANARQTLRDEEKSQSASAPQSLGPNSERKLYVSFTPNFGEAPYLSLPDFSGQGLGFLARSAQAKPPRMLEAFSSPTNVLGTTRKVRGIHEIIDQSFQSQSDRSFRYRCKAPREKQELVILDIPTSSSKGGHVPLYGPQEAEMEDIEIIPEHSSTVDLTKNGNSGEPGSSGRDSPIAAGKAPCRDDALPTASAGSCAEGMTKPLQLSGSVQEPLGGDDQNQTQEQPEEVEEPETQAWESVAVMEEEHIVEDVLSVSLDAGPTPKSHESDMVMEEAVPEPQHATTDLAVPFMERDDVTECTQESETGAPEEPSTFIDGPTLVPSDVESDSDLSSIDEAELQQMEESVGQPDGYYHGLNHDDRTLVRSENTNSNVTTSTASSPRTRAKNPVGEQSPLPKTMRELKYSRLQSPIVTICQNDQTPTHDDEDVHTDLSVEHARREIENVCEGHHGFTDASSRSPENLGASPADPGSCSVRNDADAQPRSPSSANFDGTIHSVGAEDLAMNRNQGVATNGPTSMVAPPQPQSPWNGNDVIAFQGRQGSPPHLPTNLRFESHRSESPESKSCNSSSSSQLRSQTETWTAPAYSQQSPWHQKDIVSQKQNRFGEINRSQLPILASQALSAVDNQSPWRKGDSQIPQIPQIPQPAPQLVRTSSPPISPFPSRALISVETPESPMSTALPGCHRQVMDPTDHDSQPAHPSTPETKHSSLPTPDFTLSIKSLREFMTPSPERRKRTRSGAVYTPGESTCVHMAADVLSNPWEGQLRKKRKRVSFAPLPGEEDNSAFFGTQESQGQCHSAELPTRNPITQTANRPRAASPPPAAALAELPREVERFGEHFAAMATRRARKPWRPRKGARLLPSQSQQTCESPAVVAMAEAFIDAEKHAAVAETPGRMRVDAEDGREAPVKLQGVLKRSSPFEDEQPIDDVSAVMDNLDDFLNILDAEVEDLAQTNALAQADAGRGSLRLSGFQGSPGLHDVGVWD